MDPEHFCACARTPAQYSWQFLATERKSPVHTQRFSCTWCVCIIVCSFQNVHMDVRIGAALPSSIPFCAVHTFAQTHISTNTCTQGFGATIRSGLRTLRHEECMSNNGCEGITGRYLIEESENFLAQTLVKSISFLELGKPHPASQNAHFAKKVTHPRNFFKSL